jgi:hypothetical protein
VKIAPAATFLTVCVVGFAQPYDTFRGRITGGGGDRGKCTIEVAVDGTAEIEVVQADGRMNTLAGARAMWRSMECNMGIPANPAEFKFSPQSGRGKQYVVRQPQENRGIAVIRIEDSAGGSETYRFNLEWRGTGGGLTTGGFGNGGSIFDPPRGPANLPQPNFPTSVGGPPLAGWSDQVDFRGRGQGYYRSFRGSDDMLTDTVVSIDRGGRVQVEFNTNRNERIVITGRLVLADRDRLVANMAGGEIQGTMEILLDTRNRVQELAMTGVGRNRFELRWQPR